ncbi:MAG: tRNA lysidine(34) synthetase TilS [Verrucomicrobiia bacterium]
MTKFFSQLPTQFVYALSGGVDSVALLHSLREAGFQPIVAHFNHRWFPHEDEYEKFCCALAKKWKLKCVTKRAKKSDATTEAAGREARYDFLVQTEKRFRCSGVVTAHTASDQAETVLMRLLRGAGSRGLSAMKWKSQRGDVTIFRPWLEATREEVLHYAKTHHLKWHEDPVNEELTRFRGKIRHRLLPYLKKQFDSNLVKRLCQTADLLAEEDAYLSEQSRNLLEKIRDRSQPHRLLTRELAKLPLALQRRVIREWLEREKVNDIDFELIENILRMLQDRSLARCNLTQGWQVCRKEARLWIRKN